MKNRRAVNAGCLVAGFFIVALSAGLQASDGDYLYIEDDLSQGRELQDVSDRAYEHSGAYWEYVHGHPRDQQGHAHKEHPAGAPEHGSHDGDDELLSAGEAVTAIFRRANENPNADPAARDIVRVTTAVVDSWPDCEDTFDAVRAAVALQPERADEIVANIAVKRDCNCLNGGLWLDDRELSRLRVRLRHAVLDAPFQCSCSQVAMYAGIAGLPENREWNDEAPDAEKERLIRVMTERVTVITERTAALQSLNSWDCGCTDVNIAASMQGIPHDELRDGTFDLLAEKYVEEAGDTGLVVDVFGIVGMYPAEYWGEQPAISRSNDLRRKGEEYRGDNLLLDPFTPATRYAPFGDRNFENLGQHRHTSPNLPTDVFISEYLEGWNEEALQVPPGERDPDHRNRVVEIYNGSEETIDLGNGQYFLEIYGEPGPVRTVATPPALVKRTISLQSDVTFDFDKSDIRPEASEDLQRVLGVLNAEDIFSEVLISGHTCDLGSDDYNLGLSKRRADAVRDYLQQYGLQDVAVRTEGLGEAQPRLPNTSKANRSRNRRVDITFVTRDDAPVETAITQADPATAKKYEYTYLAPIPATVHAVESEPADTMAAGEYTEGEREPRQVIGLNGAVEPGETWIIAYNESDEVIRDLADVVTGQLDFRPNETLVIRRLGGEMALNCRAHGYAYVINFPPRPFIRYPEPGPTPEPRPPHREIASPN